MRKAIARSGEVMAGSVPRSPTPRLLAGLTATVLTVALFSLYSLAQLQGLRRLQTDTIDRNRRDSLQLLRIQNDLNQLGLAMRDMIEDRDGYGMQAWRSQFDRLRKDLDDAVRIDGTLTRRPEEQKRYLTESLDQFWRSAAQIFQIAEEGQTARARQMVIDSLQAHQGSIASTVARLLVQNNEVEEQAAREIGAIYDRVERNVYFFLTAMLAGIAAIGIALIQSNRRVFENLAALSEQRSTLARGLIGVQEQIFRSVARELHDDFGQILTAVGAMLRRMENKDVPPDSSLRQDLAEVRTIVSEALEKMRSFSQALHPTVLDDYGLERALERYTETFTRQHGIDVEFEREGEGDLPESKAIHIYRVVQEALNNVARHAGASSVTVRMHFGTGTLRVDVQDNGCGIRPGAGKGLGLIAMTERAQLMGGNISCMNSTPCGTLVRLEVPLHE